MAGSLHEQIQCVRREIRMREGYYPRAVRLGKMKRAHADYELSLMRDVLATLEKLALAEPILQP